MGGVKIKDHDFDLIANGEQFRGVRNPLCPRHLRDVQQAFHSLLQFHKSPVIGQAHDFALHPTAGQVAFCDRPPRIGDELFQAQ